MPVRLLLPLFLAELAVGQPDSRARLLLKWERVADAVHYEVEIARDSAFEQVVLLHRVESPFFYWDRIPPSTRYWHVRSVDVAGRVGQWSNVATISVHGRAPSLLRPLAGAEIPNEAGAVEFACRSSRLLRAYVFQVAAPEDTKFAAPIIERQSPNPRAALKLPSDGKFLWRVGGVDHGERRTGFSEVRSFTMVPAPRTGMRGSSPLSGGLHAGWVTNFGGVSSPYLGVGADWRTSLLDSRALLSVRTGTHGASAAIPIHEERQELVTARARVVPMMVLGIYELPLGRMSLHGGPGVAVDLAWVRFGSQISTTATWGVRVVSGAGVQMGPGRILAEVGLTISDRDSKLAELQRTGLLATVGYHYP